MGKIYDRFSSIILNSESSVEQKFIIPFLTEFLGYSPNDIIPQHAYTLKNVPINRTKSIPSSLLDIKAIPDFIIGENEENAYFVLDAKNYKEDVSDYEHQLHAYAIVCNTNLTVITNGRQFYIYDGTEIINKCEGLDEIDKNLDVIAELLHKENQKKPLINRIYKLRDLGQNDDVELFITDYKNYLKKKLNLPLNIHVLGEEVPRITRYNSFKFRNSDGQEIDEKTVVSWFTKSLQNKFLLKGVSGVGKSEFANYLVSLISESTLKNELKLIPVKVDLINWQPTSNVKKKIFEYINTAGLSENDILNSLNDGQFIIFFDGIDLLGIKNRNAFFAALKESEFLFKNNIYVLILRPGYESEFDLSDRETFTIEPPEFDDFEPHIKNVLDKEKSAIFIKELKSRKLESLAKIPIMLNFLLIYYKKIEKFPRSHLELLRNLINDYFKEFLIKIYGDSINFKFVNQALSLISYEILSFENNFRILKQKAHKIVSENIKKMEEKYELIERIDYKQVFQFLIKNNFIKQKSMHYFFWHQIFLEYFGALELISRINEGKLSIPLEKLTHNLIWKSVVSIALPEIENEVFIECLRQKNAFLYIEGVKQQEEINSEDKSQILEFLSSKFDSQLYDIRKRSMELLEGLLMDENEKISYYQNIIEHTKKPRVLEWAIERIALIKNEDILEYLFNLIDKFGENRIKGLYRSHLLRQFILIPLSNFNAKKVQEFLINEFQSKWRGVEYLTTIGKALKKISIRGELTKQIKHQILDLYKHPPTFEGIRDMKNLFRKEGMEDLIKTFPKSRKLTLFFINFMKKEKRFVWNAEYICSAILREEDVSLILNEVANKKNDIHLRSSFIHILTKSDVPVNFQSVFSIMQDLRDEGLKTENFSLKEINNDYKEFREANPEYDLAFLFSSLIEFFNETGVQGTLKLEKLKSFLSEYLMFPNEMVLQQIFIFYKKYDVKILEELEILFLNRSLRVFLEAIMNSRRKRFIKVINEYFQRHFDNPEDFHDHLLIQQLIELLQKANEKEIAMKLYSRYVNDTAEIPNIALGLSVLEGFPSDYSMNILETLYQRIIDKEGELHWLTDHLVPIHSKRFYDFCLKLGKHVKDYQLGEIMRILSQANANEYEDEIIKFLKDKITVNTNSFVALDILAYIGTEKSIKFLKNFLGSDDVRVKNRAYFCIQAIYERENYLWYNGEEEGKFIS